MPNSIQNAEVLNKGIVGDSKYLLDQVCAEERQMFPNKDSRLFLHAIRYGLPNVEYTDGRVVTVESRLPDVLQKCLDSAKMNDERNAKLVEIRREQEAEVGAVIICFQFFGTHPHLNESTDDRATASFLCYGSPARLFVGISGSTYFRSPLCD